MVAIGNPSLTYQWQVSTNGTDWMDVMNGTGAQTAIYILGDVSPMINVTIVEPILPETKQHSSFVWVAGVGAIIVLEVFIIRGGYKNKKLK